MNETVMTEHQVWYYYLNRNMWAKGVEFEHLKNELRKQNIIILEQKARIKCEDGEYVVFIEKQFDDNALIVFPDNHKQIVKTCELRDY